MKQVLPRTRTLTNQHFHERSCGCDTDSRRLPSFVLPLTQQISGSFLPACTALGKSIVPRASVEEKARIGLELDHLPLQESTVQQRRPEQACDFKIESAASKSFTVHLPKLSFKFLSEAVLRAASGEVEDFAGRGEFLSTP